MALFEGRREGRKDIKDVSLIGLFDLLNWSTAPVGYLGLPMFVTLIRIHLIQCSR